MDVRDSLCARVVQFVVQLTREACFCLILLEVDLLGVGLGAGGFDVVNVG